MILNYEKYDLRYLKFEEFVDDGIVHAFTTRHGGVSCGHLGTLNLSYSRGDSESNVKENYRRVAEALGLDYRMFIGCRQVHGTDVAVIEKGDLNRTERLVCDGMVTRETGVVLVTVHADCTPVYLYDPVVRAVGMVHSGWKGTAGQVAVAAVRKMQLGFGSDPGSIKVHIGPSICKKCFEVKEDVKNEFEARLPWSARYITPKDADHWLIDLHAIITDSLTEAGVQRKNISKTEECTMEKREVFFSHRGEKGQTGTMAALISLKAEGK